MRNIFCQKFHKENGNALRCRGCREPETEAFRRQSEDWAEQDCQGLDDCQHCKCEKHSAVQTIAKKPKQQRIEAKADRTDTERIILDVYRPGAGGVLSDLVDIEIFCAQKEKCKNRQHGNGAEG